LGPAEVTELTHGAAFLPSHVLYALSGIFLTTCCKIRLEISGVGVRTSAINKFQITNHKNQMVRQTHHLTTLSQVEGQITMTEIQNSKQLAFDLI
jgi:hypothetical protein